MNDVLVTGTGSGLGKCLNEYFGGDAWKHDTPLPTRYYDLIIHCGRAADPAENITVTRKLLGIPAGLFVYISSVDVYRELSGFSDSYSYMKLACEHLVRASCDDYLIIRPGALIGVCSRKPNTIMRMLAGERLRVTPDSTFGMLHHKSLLPYIKPSRRGTVTLAGNVMAIKDIAVEFGLSPEYGEFPYHTPPVRPTHDTIKEIKDYIDDTGTGTNIVSDQGQAVKP